MFMWDKTITEKCKCIFLLYSSYRIPYRVAEEQ